MLRALPLIQHNSTVTHACVAFAAMFQVCSCPAVVRAYYYQQQQCSTSSGLLYTCTLGGDFGYDFYTKESLDMMPSSVALHVGMISPFETESRVEHGT
jgi:hypothetical protein